MLCVPPRPVNILQALEALPRIPGRLNLHTPERTAILFWP
jgi:hypothetical protein